MRKEESNSLSSVRFFRQMAIAGFQMESEQLWGFYFLDDKRDRLLNICGELEDMGYSKTMPMQLGKKKWQLYVTKVKRLTPEKLYKINSSFKALARHYNIESYDGWDVKSFSDNIFEGRPYLQKRFLNKRNYHSKKSSAQLSPWDSRQIV